MFSPARTDSLSASPRRTGKAPSRSTNRPSSLLFQSSDFAIQCICLGQAAPTKMGSTFDMWLLATTTGPSGGTCSVPSTFMPKSIRNNAGNQKRMKR
ncbi:MAG: hypothetical protein BWY79_01196 [Actinobacteria bacterium ADurb.Bin444]|nr:MAG: hypothetical protein BWY79_01196 [Actinobacteria bacterium ADurb.Bin444]